MSWTTETVPATAILATVRFDDIDDETGKPITAFRVFTDAAKLAAHLAWATERSDRMVTVVDTCTPHGAAIVAARVDSTLYGTTEGLCEDCVSDQAAAEARRAQDRRRRQDASFRRYSGRIARYGS